MSKKPIKKSDESKDWIQKRKTRKIESKLEYHLIVCEGTETEPNYFEAIKSKIKKQRNDKITIKIVGKGRGTTNLVEEAIKEVNKATNYISNVWLIYDKDEFTEESFDKVVTICNQLNKEEGTIYHPIWSNECIETWILLHFIRFDTPINRKDCIRKLNTHFKQRKLGKYEKNDEKLYEKIKPYEETAIKNAKWLENKYNTQLPSQMNPCTKVYYLIEFLNKYM